MKEHYAATKRVSNGSSPTKPGANGMIDSDSEDEKIGRLNKHKAASPVDAAKKETQKGDGHAETIATAKRTKSAA